MRIFLATIATILLTACTLTAPDGTTLTAQPLQLASEDGDYYRGVYDLCMVTQTASLRRDGAVTQQSLSIAYMRCIGAVRQFHDSGSHSIPSPGWPGLDAFEKKTAEPGI